MKEPHELTVDDLAKDLHSFVRKRILIDGADFSVDTTLESVGIDSVSLLEILLYLERQFDIYIADEQLIPENIVSIKKLAETAYSKGSNP